MPETTTPPKARWYDYLAWGEMPISDPVFGVLAAADIATPADSPGPPKAATPGLFAALRSRLLSRAPLS